MCGVVILILFVFQVRLEESQIDAGFKSLFRQLAGPVSSVSHLQEVSVDDVVMFYLTFIVRANRTWRSA